MPKHGRTPPGVAHAISSMLDDYRITVPMVMEGLDRGQTTVWAWRTNGTQDLETFVALEDLAGAPRGEILRRSYRRNGEFYVPWVENMEDMIRTDTTLLPHLRALVLENYQNALRMSDEARRGGGAHVSAAS